MLSASDIKKMVALIQKETKESPTRIREAITKSLTEDTDEDSIVERAKKILKIERLREEGFHTTL